MYAQMYSSILQLPTSLFIAGFACLTSTKGDELPAACTSMMGSIISCIWSVTRIYIIGPWTTKKLYIITVNVLKSITVLCIICLRVYCLHNWSILNWMSMKSDIVCSNLSRSAVLQVAQNVSKVLSQKFDWPLFTYHHNIVQHSETYCNRNKRIVPANNIRITQSKNPTLQRLQWHQ